MCAKRMWPLGVSFPVFLSSLNISTLKMALGMASRTMPSISMTSSLDKLIASSLDLLSLSCWDGQAAMKATYFFSCGTKSAKWAENPCPPRKHLAVTAIYRLYTSRRHFASTFFRISDKNFRLVSEAEISALFCALAPRKTNFFTKTWQICTKSDSFAACKAYFKENFSGSKSGSSQKRVMISVWSFRMAMECSK